MVIHGTQPLQRNRTEPLTLDNLPLVHQSAKIQPDSISSVPTLKGESTWKGPVSAERVVICFAFKRLAVCCFFTPVVFDKVVANRKACLLSLLKTEYSYIYIIYILYILYYYIVLLSVQAFVKANSSESVQPQSWVFAGSTDVLHPMSQKDNGLHLATT